MSNEHFLTRLRNDHDKNIKKLEKKRHNDLSNFLNDTDCKKVYETLLTMVNNLKATDVLNYDKAYDSNTSEIDYNFEKIMTKPNNTQIIKLSNNFDFGKCIINHQGINNIKLDLLRFSRYYDLKHHLKVKAVGVYEKGEYKISMDWSE